MVGTEGHLYCVALGVTLPLQFCVPNLPVGNKIVSSLTEDLKLIWYLNRIMLIRPINLEVPGIPDVRYKQTRNEREHRVELP